MLKKYCRICWNTNNWERPSGSAQEGGSAYTQAAGFGFEEWLFRFDWLLSGYDDTETMYRYSHIVPLAKYPTAYSEKHMDIFLYAKNIVPARIAIAVIKDAFVPSLDEMIWAAKNAEQNGWIDQMRTEMLAAGGKERGILKGIKQDLFPPADWMKKDKRRWAQDLSDIRFDPKNVIFFDPRFTIPEDNKVYRSNRYHPLDWDVEIPQGKNEADLIGKSSTTEDEWNRLQTEAKARAAAKGDTWTPRQARIQKPLGIQLSIYFASFGGIVRLEDERVDISITMPSNERTYIEIKPAQTALSSIRLALGQLLEYAHYPDAQKAKKFVIVGEMTLQQDDVRYLHFLRSTYSLNIDYVAWPFGTKALAEAQLSVFFP